jgi:FMN-dependent oxidoreductase (nitrilotriacetate monooxygenase family)
MIRKLHLATLGSTIGSHLGGWRHPEAFADSVAGLEEGLEVAMLAEEGKFDMIFLADGNGVRAMANPLVFAANAPGSRPGWFEPTTYLSAVAMRTKHLGLVATATTSLEQPFTVARKFASLDKLSGGRAGWNVVTTGVADEARNFSMDQLLPRDERYERAQEFVEVVLGLWDSWAPDAFPQNKLTGQYLDPSKVHALNHKGKHFSIAGPLNVARSPQGRPIIFSAGQSGTGKEMSAKYADCVFAKVKTKELAIELYQDIKERMPAYGRHPDSMRILPGALIYLGRTAAEAEDLLAELNSWISPELGLDFLSREVDMDLSQYPLDGPMPKIDGERLGTNSTRISIGRMAERDGLSIRQTYERVASSLGHPVFKGSPTDVADQIEDWYTSRACDGFVLQFPILPRGLRDFVQLVVPELQRRGIFRRDYDGMTLRENMGLDPAPSQYDPDPASR